MRLRATARFMLFAAVLGGIIGYILARIDEQPPPTIVVSSAIAGLVLGAIIGGAEEFLVPRMRRRLSLAALSLVRVCVITTSIFVVVLLSNIVRMGIDFGYDPYTAAQTFFRASGPRDLGIVLALGVFVTSVFVLRHLYTPRELWHYVTGRYEYPVSEERIVLFADLAGSTRIAERLGPIRYSSFIRDLFADITDPIVAWRGSILQYTGDGFIVTWSRGAGVKQGTCVRCFIDMRNALVAMSAYYEDNYAVRPHLRGGIHLGEVVVTRIGETRTTMTYLGDAMNVAARLEALCRERDCQMLISGTTVAALEQAEVNVDALGLVQIGPVDIRGRSADLDAFALHGPRASVAGREGA